jgi:hypothetical protein
MLLQEKPVMTIVNITDLFTIRRRVIIGNSQLELLDEKVISRNGPIKRVRRWYRGAHPGFGTIIKGFTGLETVVEQDVIVALHKVQVVDSHVS